MSKFIVTIIAVASVISVLSPLFADKIHSNFPKVLESMVTIQKSLADDRIDSVERHTDIISKWVHENRPLGIDHEVMSKSLKQLKTSEIKTVREGFMTFNLEIAKHLKMRPISFDGYLKVFCPMAKAEWIQKSGKIANPYYGKSMLRCGTIIK